MLDHCLLQNVENDDSGNAGERPQSQMLATIQDDGDVGSFS